MTREVELSESDKVGEGAVVCLLAGVAEAKSEDLAFKKSS
jgi:hypothetical protein